jgi:hypothetical protein
MQSLFYEQVVPVSKDQHGDWSVKVGDDYSFASKVNAIPLTMREFPQAVQDYPIVFIENNDETIIPVAILGLEEQQNLYIKENGEWNANYIPAFVRRYPFIFSLNEEENRFTLCLDETFSGFNQEGRGERLFDAEGEQTQYLQGVLNFLKSYQTAFQSSQQFSQKLKELNLLETMRVDINAQEDNPLSLSGFLAVNREQLQNLSGEQLYELMQLGLMEAIYLHLFSMNTFSKLIELRNELVPQKVA